MSFDWYAQHKLDLPSWESVENQARTSLRNKGRRDPRPGDITKEAETLAQRRLAQDSQSSDPYASLQLLSQTVADEDPKGRWTVQARKVYADGLSAYGDYITKQQALMKALGLETPALQVCDLEVLPEHSFFLYLPFRLAAPYLSKDDEPLYIHDNPVRKDAVFRVPMVSATGWKGALRAALRYTLEVEDSDPRIVRLFGNERADREGFRRGRLVTFPTFFDGIAVDVINPHLRETSAGDKPIYLEEVPAGAQGKLALLYTPTPDPVLRHREAAASGSEIARTDARLALRAVHFLLTQHGFGAKTTAGMGRAEGRLPANGYFLLPRQGDAVDEPFILESMEAVRRLSNSLLPPKSGGSHG